VGRLGRGGDREQEKERDGRAHRGHVDPFAAKRYKPAVSPLERFRLVPGTTPLVLVAPHGGRRDPVRRPWASGSLKTNDLYTAELTVELAARTGAAALVNAIHDRNDVDLNRITAANESEPEFLAALCELLAGTIARHGRAVLLTVHGWNVIQPAVDLGLGCAPGADPYAVTRAAAVSAPFAARAVRALVEACAAHGVAATIGARYPARHRENLLQLFTGRYVADERPLVLALAQLGAQVEAVQMELGIPLRWPGPWRDRLLGACLAALPALLGDAHAAPPPAADPAEVGAAQPVARRLQFAGPALCGLVALDAGPGGRLLLFRRDGGLTLFTGERTAGSDGVAGLALAVRADAGATVRFAGPVLHFPDTTPFLDLEAGLARAQLGEATVGLEFVPDHAGGEFGRVSGRIVVDGVEHALAAEAYADEGLIAGPWPRVRAALRLPDGGGLNVTVDPAQAQASGFVCHAGRHVAVAGGQAQVASTAAGIERVDLELELENGERLRLAATATHALPVVRVRGPHALRIEFAACRLADGGGPVGWCEVGGL
jgi:hypothetical protein